MITSFDNPKLKRIRALLTRGRERKKEGLYVVEGLRLCREVPEEFIEEIYISASFEIPQNLQVLLKKKGYETLSDDVFMRTADTVTPQGILFVVRMNRRQIPEIPNPLFVVLEDVQDPGNIGTIIRTAEGAGATAVFLSSGCADLYSPKVVRATMGSLYRVPIIPFEDMKSLLERFHKKDVTVYAASLPGSVDYEEPDYTTGTAFLIGNEGNGLKAETMAMADQNIRIPMEGKLESLNASVAASLLMYTAYGKRRKK